jgi:hypothetical protein
MTPWRAEAIEIVAFLTDCRCDPSLYAASTLARNDPGVLARSDPPTDSLRSGDAVGLGRATHAVGQAHVWH